MVDKRVEGIANILIYVGAINWGLVGLFGLNVVEKFIPANFAKWVYVLVGAAAVLRLVQLKGKIM